MAATLDGIKDDLDDLRDCFRTILTGLNRLVEHQETQNARLAAIEEALTEPAEEGGELAKLLRDQTAAFERLAETVERLPGEMGKALAQSRHVAT